MRYALVMPLGHAEVLTKEFETIADAFAEVQRLEDAGKGWRSITIIHIEDLPIVLGGAEHIGGEYL